jgi:hypothetical protein
MQMSDSFCGNCGASCGRSKISKTLHQIVIYGSLVAIALLLYLYGQFGFSYGPFGRLVKEYPSEADARQVFENMNREGLNKGLMRIVSFRKTNAQNAELFGIKLHVIHYQVQIDWPKGVNSHCDPNRFTGWDCYGVEIHKVGETQTKNSYVQFEKTEKGWRGPDGNNY